MGYNSPLVMISIRSCYPPTLCKSSLRPLIDMLVAVITVCAMCPELRRAVP